MIKKPARSITDRKIDSMESAINDWQDDMQHKMTDDIQRRRHLVSNIPPGHGRISMQEHLEQLARKDLMQEKIDLLVTRALSLQKQIKGNADARR